MAEKKQALLLFGKPPVPGMVKTRLTTAHGGFLTDEQAAEFFRRSLYDVAEASMHALIELQRANDALVAIITRTSAHGASGALSAALEAPRQSRGMARRMVRLAPKEAKEGGVRYGF